MIGHWTCKPHISLNMRGNYQAIVKSCPHLAFPPFARNSRWGNNLTIAWPSSNSYHRPRFLFFCWFWWGQSWQGSPYHRWCTSPPQDINMRGEILMTRGLLLKPSDHVIQVPGGISTSLFSPCSSLVLLHLWSSPIYQVHQRHFSEDSFSLIKHQYWVGIGISWLSIDIKQQEQEQGSRRSAFVRRQVRNNGEANAECRPLSQSPLW